MVMTRTQIRNLADNLAHSKADSSTLEDSYNRLIEKLALTSAPFLDDANYTPTDGTAEYSYPFTAIKLLAVFHGATQLPEATPKELEAYDKDWRAAAEDTPVVHTFSDRDARKVRLWPTPSTTTSNGGKFIYALRRTSDIPVYLALMLAFHMLAEEFAYPSQWQDKAMAEACAEMAKLLKAFVGV